VQERIDSLNYRTNVPFRAHPANPGLSGFLGQLFGEMNGDHEDGNFRKQLRYLTGNLNPV
jgi:hypothetical protein